MNHIYNIVWNQATSCYQVVTEIARGKSKSNKKSAVAVLGAVLGVTSLPAFAGPTGGQVTAGSATIAQSGTFTTINQTSVKAAIDWTQFSVGANESVRFNQPNASAITLNRVTGTERSAIMGSISANGQVFILNPNGVLFGAGSQVNVGSLTASTLGLDNANFMAGNYKFAGNGSGSVVNNGTIAIAPGGTLAFMAPVVQNTGTLSAPGGSLLLAAAQGVTLTMQADGGLVAYTLDAGTAQALVDNGGLIEVGGGHVVLTAKGVDALSHAVVNHSGVIEAQTVGSKNGVIELLGDMQSGTVNVSGKLDASAPNADGKGGDGGFIETSAATVKVANTAQITTAAVVGKAGTWLIDPLDITINSGLASVISSSLNNGNVTISTAGANTPSTAGSEAMGNGDIFVNSAVNWSANKFTLNAGRHININANLNASGTAKLAFEYGQASTTGAGSNYVLANGAKVNLPAGENFSTKQGSAGAVNNFTVITSLGAAGSRTGTDLQGMNGDINKNYILGADIDASETATWSGGAGFHPIYSSGYSATNRYDRGYAGVFDGMNHVVSNLTIDKTKATTDRASPDWYNNISLFDTLSGTVKNFNLVDINYKGVSSNEGSVLGGIAGFNSGTISKVNVSGVIDGAYGGGVVGRNSTTAYSPTYMAGDNGGIVDATSTVTLVAYGGAGGIAYENNGVIKNSSYSGDVTLSSVFGRAGGIFSAGNSGSVDACYSAGTLNGPFSTYQNMGGGIAASSGTTTITNSYSTMKISGFSDVAGIVVVGGGSVRNSYFAGELTYVPVVYNGIDYGSLSGISDDLNFGATVVNSYWDSAKVGTVKNQGGGTKVQLGTPKTTAEMQQQATYAGWDFVNTWRIVEGSSYPLLRALTQGKITLDVTASNARKTYDGNTIATLADLQALPGGFTVTAGNTLLNGDTLPALNAAGTGIWSGALNINGAGNTWAGAKNAGTYAIVPGGLSSQKYEIVYVNGSLTIDPAIIVAVGVSGSRVYDGTRLANWNDNTQLIGLLLADQGHVALVSGAGVLASKDAGTQQLISLGTLALGGAAAGNYQLSTTGSNWTIQPRALDLSVRKIYDTTSRFSSGFAVTNGLVDGDAAPTITGTATTSSSNAGTYTSFNSNQLVSSDSNYTVNPLGAVTATIDPATLTAIGVTGSRVYDGTQLANWNDNTQLVGILTGDQGNVALTSGAGILASKNVGTQSLVSLGTLALGGSAAGNYQLDTTGSHWTIAPRPVTFTGSQTYNGTTVADWRGNTYALEGIIQADRGLVDMASGVTELPSPDVGNYLIQSLGSLTLGGLEAANYKLMADRSAWTVTPASLLVAPATASMVYNYGDTLVTGGGLQIVEGKLFKDDHFRTLLSHYEVRFSDGNVGSNKTLKISNAGVEDDNGGRNYVLTLQEGHGEITPRPVYIVVKKPLDGNPDFTSGFEVSNKRNDSVEVTGTAVVSGTAGVFNTFESFNLVSSNPNFTAAQLAGVSAQIGDVIDLENPIIGYLTNISHGASIDYVNGYGIDVGATTESIPVHYGDVIDTGDGTATVNFTDGSVLNLREGTTVELSPGAGGIAMNPSGMPNIAAIILNDGRLWGRIIDSRGINFGGGMVNGVRG